MAKLTKKELFSLFKSLGIRTTNLKTNRELYGANKYTCSYKESSMWYCEYHPETEYIEINTKYFGIPDGVNGHNKGKTIR